MKNEKNAPGGIKMTIRGIIKPVISAFSIFIMLVTLAGCSSKGPTDPASLRGGETRATLSPADFGGVVARAYWVAKEIPEILDSLYCYCDCEKHFDHKSLLTCYVDTHAAYCDICIEEALTAYDLHKQGKDVLTIRKTIDERFSARRH